VSHRGATAEIWRTRSASIGVLGSWARRRLDSDSPRPFLRGLVMREGVRIRLIHFGVALLAALIAAISPAAASSLTIGLPANNGSSIITEQIGGSACQPFGCPADVMNGGITSLLSWPPEYQQVYARPPLRLEAIRSRESLSRSQWDSPTPSVAPISMAALSKFRCRRHRLRFSTQGILAPVSTGRICRQTSEQTTPSCMSDRCQRSRAGC